MSDARGRRAEVVRLAAPSDGSAEPDAPLDVLARWHEHDVVDGSSLELLASIERDHRQLRELRLEAAWQRSFGWFVARSVVVFAMLVLLGVSFVGDAVPFDVVGGALAGVGLFYLVIVVTAPLRLRRHRAIRRATLARHADALRAHADGD